MADGWKDVESKYRILTFFNGNWKKQLEKSWK